MSTRGHVNILDAMRGMAALAVVLFHYSGSILNSITPNYLTPFFSQGKLGVQVFFVISGFVLPFALHRAGYTLKGFGYFMARRWMRIAPPAYMAALFMILYYLTAVAINGYGIAGWEFPGFGLHTIISNLTFTESYFDDNWYNFAYWSLTVEFEFYIVVGLMFPLLMDAERRWLAPVVIIALQLTSLFVDLVFFKFVEYFMFGLIIFLWKEQRVNNSAALLLVLLCCLLGLESGKILATIVALISTAIIASGTQYQTKVTNWLGMISYSLYITHVPVGNFAESALKRVIPLHEYPIGKVIMLVVYVILSLIFARIFHHFVETPFIKWSKVLAKPRRSTVSLTDQERIHKELP